jgi:hypothetical protein
MYYSYVEIEYVAMSFSPARMNLALKLLTLSFPGGAFRGHLAVAIHISPNNGPIEIILSEKLIYYVPPIHFACSIM